jgi:glycerol uptake facilitator-like aquaporin
VPGTQAAAVPFAVGAHIAAAYWYTASTSFANPAVTLARAVSDTFVGIRPVDVPGFLAAQELGGAAGAVIVRWLVAPLPGSTAKLLGTLTDAHDLARE